MRPKPTTATPPEPSGRAHAGSATAGRLEAALLGSAVVLFCVGYAVALTAPGLSYSWHHDMVSDLGRASCRTWYGSWVCSPRAHWFDAFVGAAGLCLIAATLRLRRLWGPAFTVAMGSLGVGLAWLAVFPSDGPLPLHMVGAVLALPVPAAAIFVSGLRPDTPWGARDRGLRTVLGLAALVLCLDHLAPAPAPVPRGGAETVTIGLLLILLCVEAVRCHRAARR